MLIPIIKDFNNAFSYLVSNSVEKTKQVFDPVSKSLLHLSEHQSDQSGTVHDILKIGYTGIRICFLFLFQTIQYIISFQWLRDFAYLPISIPNHIVNFNQTNGFMGKAVDFNNTVISLIDNRPNVLQRFLFSNQTITKSEINLAVSDHSLPYNNFILGLPNATHSGAPTNGWSLSFLSNKWFDPLTAPVNFLSTGLESGSKNISQLSSLPEQITGDLRISNIIVISILIAIATGFSSFLNSFFISFPLSLTNLLSLRYLMVQKFWAGCLSVLGIVFGEIVFMFFLILPPPFIQITLVYLESIWPYIIGLGLMIFIIFDLISNPYTNTMSLYQSNNQRPSGTNNPSLTKQTSIFATSNYTRFMPIKLGNHGAKILLFSFLLALTEQSCYFSFFGSLNLSSTGNFLDTYLFAASKSPIVLFFSCIGFLIGSFLAITIYNLIIAKTIFLIAGLTIKIKQYNFDFIRNWIFNRQVNFKTSTERSKDLKNDYIVQTKFFILRIYSNLKNSIMLRFGYLFSFFKSKDSLKSLGLALKNLLQLFLGYLPGGKRMVFFLFPGQAQSYKSDFQTKGETQLTSSNNAIFNNRSFLSIESTIENLLRTDGLKMVNSASSSIASSSRDSLSTPTTMDQSSGNVLQFGGSAFYNKIDKVLLTCLITLSFTTIPYYSFDYLINNFFGFIPQDQILNAHSLRVNFPDYTNLLGITLSDNNSVINTDVSLYDRAHFMYGEWPNSFESLNYQGELMWTNLRDHRRQKRTRRSTRLKFKTLKTKISTSWKEFKLSSGFSGSNGSASISDDTKWNSNFSKDHPINSKMSSNERAFNSLQTNNTVETSTADNSVNPSFKNSIDSENPSTTPFVNTNIDQKRDNALSEKNNAAQKSLRNKNNLSNVFYKIFLASPFKGDSLIGSNRYNQDNFQKKSLSKAFELTEGSESVSQTTKVSKNEEVPKIPEEIRRSTSLSETIKPLSTSTFIDLSGGEKYIKTYPKNWKRVITEKYYQNPIYKTILANDLKNFLKREPSSQQLTNNQETELYFLRVKMAHYYDSLRFYFTLKESINNTRSKAEGFLKYPSQNTLSESNPLDNPSKQILAKGQHTQNKKDFEKIYNEKRKPRQSLIENKFEPSQERISFSTLKNQTRDMSVFSQKENMETGIETSLKSPPFQFKSMTSMNYRQQFKGTLKTVKQLFAISLPESVLPFSDATSEQNSSLKRNNDFVYNQANNTFPKSTAGTERVEKSYKYDKYLFNEYASSKNEFLHEETPGFTHQKQSIPNLREYHSQNSAMSPTKTKKIRSSHEAVGSRSYKGIGLATKNIYNMFGSNDPFYVGWDQNLRKFVLTSRVLNRSSALNYSATNSSVNVDQIKNNNNKDIFDTDGSNVPFYSNLTSRSNLSKVISQDPTKNSKTLEQKKQNFNQQSVHFYRPYTCWPFFKHQLKNLPNRPYFVLYENYLNILNKRIHLFSNININDIDTKSLTFLYSYSFNNNVKKYVSQLPINIYKQSMRPSSLENLFTPTSNARSSFLWPGSTMPAWEYYFW